MLPDGSWPPRAFNAKSLEPGEARALPELRRGETAVSLLRPRSEAPGERSNG